VKKSKSVAAGKCRIHIRPGRGILVVDSQGLGDVVQSLPLLKAVCEWARDRYPVHVMFASPRHYELVQEEGLEISPLFVHHLRSDLLGLFGLWKELAGKFDLIVCAPEMSAAKLVLLKIVTRASHAIGEASPPFSRFLSFSAETSWTKPFLETQDEIASALGIGTPLEPPSIRLNSNEIAWASSELSRAGFACGEPIVGVQCSSVVPSKRWPAENYGELVKGLSELFPKLKVISFGTLNERPIAGVARRIAAGVPWLEATGAWTIRQSLAMLSSCDLFVSGDTGLMHMAAALGVKTLSIFGPTSVTRRAPQHNDGIALMPASPCHPCFKGHWNPCACIRQIMPRQAISAAELCLSSRYPCAEAARK
jgi:ADP-heptose:LPS heptosyltransferase